MSPFCADERCAELERTFARAEEATSVVSHFIRIGKRVVKLRFAGDALVRALTPAFGHLRTAASEPELTICVADSESTAVTPALAPESLLRAGGREASPAHFGLEPHSESLHCFDPVRRRAFFWTRSAGLLKPWDRAAPLRLLLAWWAESVGAQLAHGAVVGRADRGILLAGAGGSGKSTMTLACLEAGLACCGDDYVWIELGDPPVAYSLYSSIKLERSALERHFSNLVPLARESGAEKATLFLADLPRVRPLSSMPLYASAALTRSGEPLPRVTETSPMTVLSALAPSSLLQVPGASPGGLRRLAGLVRQTRSLQFSAGTDYCANARAIDDLITQRTSHTEPSTPLDSAARVSVVIAVRDGAAYLGEALRSVLTQRRPAQEIIVVDDGSSDGSAELARSFPGVRCLRQDPAGQASALNAGVVASGGDFLAFLDADDRWLSDKLELQLNAFSRDPELEIVFGHARQFCELGVTSARTSRSPVPARLPSALLVRRAAWQRVGAFSSEWALGGVIEWCARAEDCGLRSRMLEDVVYERRVHGKNTTLAHPDAAREYARMLKSVLDRRRGRLAPEAPAGRAGGSPSSTGSGGAT
jgi:hypothetical protein